MPPCDTAQDPVGAKNPLQKGFMAQRRKSRRSRFPRRRSGLEGAREAGAHCRIMASAAMRGTTQGKAPICNARERLLRTYSTVQCMYSPALIGMSFSNSCFMVSGSLLKSIVLP